MDLNALKQHILQLAMQGKLIPQNASDDSAAVLLDKISKQVQTNENCIGKTESIITIDASGKIYEITKNGDKDITNEINYHIPNTWCWVRLGSVGNWQAGSTPSRSHPEYYKGNIPWIKTGELNDGYIYHSLESISDIAFKTSSVKLNKVGSILIAMYGATIGKLGILNIEATTNQACCACFPVEYVYNKFLFYFLMSHRKKFIEQGEGGAQPNISKDKIVKTLMPLPPYAEQHRIVEAVDRIFSLINSIEENQKDLNKIAYKLRSKILDIATRGKLLPQDSSDGLASFLLKQIEDEHKKKYGDKYSDSFIYKGTDERFYERTKQSDNDITCDLPFDLPGGWEFVRLSSVCTLENIKQTSGERLPYLNVKALRGMKEISYSDNGKVVNEGDMVILVDGENSGEVFTIPCRGYMGSTFRLITISNSINADFLNLNLKLYQTTFRKNKTGSAIPHLDKNLLKSTIIGLPPLAEQQRIVNTVNNLFSQLDIITNF